MGLEGVFSGCFYGGFDVWRNLQALRVAYCSICRLVLGVEVCKVLKGIVF